MSDSTGGVRHGKAERWARDLWCEAIGDSTLPKSVRLVAFALATFMNPEGVARPALATLAARAGVARSTAGEAVARMIGDGWLERLDGGGGSRRATTYRATLPAGSVEPERLRTVRSGPDGSEPEPSEIGREPSGTEARTVRSGPDTNRRTDPTEGRSLRDKLTAIGATPDEIAAVLRRHEARRDGGLRVSLLPEVLETDLAAARRQMIREQRDADAYAATHARTTAEEAIALINPAWAPLRQRIVDLFQEDGGDCRDLDRLRTCATDLATVAENDRAAGLAALRAFRRRRRPAEKPETVDA